MIDQGNSPHQLVAPILNVFQFENAEEWHNGTLDNLFQLTLKDCPKWLCVRDRHSIGCHSRQQCPDAGTKSLRGNTENRLLPCFGQYKEYRSFPCDCCKTVEVMEVTEIVPKYKNRSRKSLYIIRSYTLVIPAIEFRGARRCWRLSGVPVNGRDEQTRKEGLRGDRNCQQGHQLDASDVGTDKLDRRALPGHVHTRNTLGSSRMRWLHVTCASPHWESLEQDC